MNQRTPRTVGFRRNERNVFFHILTACNLSCSHCYINPEQHGTITVPLATMEKWLALFYHPEKETNLIFLGGEPTLHPDLAEGIKTARQLGYTSITVDSNGYLFNDLLGRVTPADLDYLSFSLDGPTPAINDPLRGQGVFNTCTANIEKAVSLGFNASAIYTVSKRNIDSLYKMPELLLDLGVKRFFIQVIGLRGKSAKTGSGNLQVTPEEWLATVPEIALSAAQAGMHVTFPKVFLDKNEKFECAGNVAENFFIFPNGRVYACPLCEDYPLHSHEIHNDTLQERNGITEKQLFTLNIPEGCVMNKLLQPGNISYTDNGAPQHRISCCLLKQEFKF